MCSLRAAKYKSVSVYLSNFSTCVPTYLHGTLMQGLYTSPAVHVDVTAVVTNTVPVDALRGAGRPEATFSIERLVDTAAREIGMDPAEFRLKNFIRLLKWKLSHSKELLSLLIHCLANLPKVKRLRC